MNTILIISCFFAVALFFVWKLRSSQKKMLAPDVQQQIGFSGALNEPAHSTNNTTMVDDLWWKELDSLNQLHFALSLSEKALPVWEKYLSSRDIMYQPSITGRWLKIDKTLLRSAIETVKDNSRPFFPASDNKKIKQYYLNFVSPVIALQDGNWLPPYPSRQIFLAVYTILRSVSDAGSSTETATLLATSIKLALDCMDMAKLYRREEIAVFINDCKSAIPVASN